MVRIGDILHAGVFALCVAGGAVLSHVLDQGAMRGIGYGLVVWVAAVLAYLAITRVTARPSAQPSAPAQTPATVDDDETAFEVEDGKND